MKNPHAIRCELGITLIRIVNLRPKLPRTEHVLSQLERRAARLQASRHVAPTSNLVEICRSLGWIEGTLRAAYPKIADEADEDLNIAFRLIDDLLIYGTTPDRDAVNDSEHALHEHENHAIPAAEFEV